MSDRCSGIYSCFFILLRCGIVHITDPLSVHSDDYGTAVEWYWRGETGGPTDKPVPEPLCLPPSPHGLTLARTLVFALRGWWLTAWTVARPLVLILQVAYLLPGPVINFLFCLISFVITLLHVWGFLGSVAWALSRGGEVVHCCVSLATQQFKRKAYQQHCCACDSSHGDVSMVTGWLSMDFYWYRKSCLEIARVQTCVCIWLRTPFGWKTKFVSGNCEWSTWVYTVDGEASRSSGLVQISDGLCAEVPLWCESGPIARRWIVPTCVRKLYDCKNES
jgi:hypothetical protein